LIARDLSYTDYMKIKDFHCLIWEHIKEDYYRTKTVREHPIGKIAERTIGYERERPDGATMVKELNGLIENI
jgi:cell division protein FtsI (penicillin-binding protein 3)